MANWKRMEVMEELLSGIDTTRRWISFGAPIDATQVSDESDLDNNDFSQLSVELAVRAIRKMEAMAPKKPITIFMNSGGGDPSSMFYLIDTILASSCQFKFYGGGQIMSSASWVMAVCDERYLYPNTLIMLHDGESEAGGSIKDMNIKLEMENRLMERLYKLFAENSRMPVEFWKEVCSRDLYLWPDEVIALGLADFIVPYKKRGNLRRKRLAALSNAPLAKDMKALIRRLHGRIKSKVAVRNFNINIPTVNPVTVDQVDPDVVIDNSPTEKPSTTETEQGSAVIRGQNNHTVTEKE